MFIKSGPEKSLHPVAAEETRLTFQGRQADFRGDRSLVTSAATTAVRANRGWTLVEMMVAVAIFSVVGAAVGSLFFFSTQSFASMVNYNALDKENRIAMDKLTMELRQSKKVTAYSTNSISFVNGDGFNITYLFSPSTRQMLRASSDGSVQALLNDCSLLSFNLFQRNPSNAVYGIWPAATNNWQLTVKVLQLTWKTSRTLPNRAGNSENVQTALIVIRKQDDGI